MASAQPGQNESADPIHIIHHAFRLGGGKERCAVALAAALRQMGRKVTVHAMTADAALAQSLGIELKMTPVSSFPRKLQTFKFFRQLERAQPQMNGLQISLSRVRVRDVLVCGGCHRGYLARTKKWTGPSWAARTSSCPTQ